MRHVGLGLLWFLALAPASTAQTCAWCEAGSGAEVSLEGVIDLHAHSAPDSGARSIDAITIAQLARDAGMRALLFKNHYTHTASLAYIVSKAVPGIELYGGIALNSTIGFNPGAVWHMANTTGRHGKVVWMPTFDSEHYHNVLAPNPNHVKISSGGKLLPETLKVLDAIKENGLALATGHSSPSESLLLIGAAKGTRNRPDYRDPPAAASSGDVHRAAEGSRRAGRVTRI